VSERIKNPALYRTMLEPVSVDEANANLTKFFEEVYAIREKHHLPDVHITIQVNIRYDDGSEGTVLTSMHIGNELQAEAMTAYSHGRQAALRQERISLLADEGGCAIKKQKNR
jgi:hypothetical protein